MVTNDEITLYRKRVSRLIMELRNLMFIHSNRTSYPTDTSIAYMLGLSPTAFSSITRQCSSMSGVVLHKLLLEIAKRSDASQFASFMSNFFED